MGRKGCEKAQPLVYSSNGDPLHFVECYGIAGAIIELSGTRAFMRRHRFRVLERAAGFKIGGDAGGAERMDNRS